MAVMVSGTGGGDGGAVGSLAEAVVRADGSGAAKLLLAPEVGVIEGTSGTGVGVGTPRLRGADRTLDVVASGASSGSG